MRNFLITITTLLFSNLLFSNDLSFTNIEILANESGVTDLLLDNPEDQIAGIQFTIVDYPNHGLFTSVSATDRMPNFMVEFNEQEDGSVIILAFSLTGDAIETGSGAILSLTYQHYDLLEQYFFEDRHMIFHLP